MRIGLLGGTFDPPHLGHVALAKAALAGLELDELLLVPTSRNPNKADPPLAPSRARVTMASLAVEDVPGLGVCDIEVTRGGPSYMVETVAELRMARPGTYWLVLGVDAFKSLPSWKDPERLARLCRFAVASRQSESVRSALEDLPPELARLTDLVEMTPVDASSSKIREFLAKGFDTSQWLDPKVHEFIRKGGLYR